MLVDNSHPSHLSADFADFINTDLFAPANSSSSSPPSDNDSSPPQSPFHSLLTTPPQDLPPAAFPDFGISSLASASPNGSGFSFLDDESLKDPAAYDFMSLPGMNSIMNYPGMHMPMDLPMGFNMDSVMSMDGASSSDLASYLGIDPALVGTSAPSSSATELETVDEESDEAQSPPQKQGEKTEEQRERLTLTITPAKVGGHGKSRKGTVQSGGIVKKTPTSHSSRDKENSLLSTTSGQSAASIAANAAALKRTKARAPSEVSSIDDLDESPFTGSGNKDDLAIDWRPPPEVLAKMSSKEKRQLRNKISARNFRVRRKEYITTLEGDIAERDRLLDAVRSELGSSQSENLALRQEIAALKKILLEGRGTEALASLNLPPPAPLAVSMTPGSVSGTLPAFGPSSGSALLGESSTSLASTNVSGVIDPTLTPHSSATNATGSLSLPTPSSSPQPSSSLGLLTPNTQKDLPTSPRLGAAFWGGTTRSSFMGMGGGITPVHTVLIPDLHTLGAGGINEGVTRGEKSVTRALQENMNPALNGMLANNTVNMSANFGVPSSISGFEGWADNNPLTLKTLDAYRMHLWGKMAAQQHFQKSQHAQNHRQPPTSSLTGLASNLRPLHFSSPPSTPGPSHSTLSALLSGKHSSLASSSYSSYNGLPTPPGSPNLGFKGPFDRSKEKEKDREQRDQTAALAVLAGQTLFKKLGGAFWDAFSGHTTPSSSSSSVMGASKNWDVDKVRKVLEGKAIVKVVDVEPSSSAVSSLTAGMASMSVGGGSLREESKKMEERKCRCTEILEESMRSLTVSKKS